MRGMQAIRQSAKSSAHALSGMNGSSVGGPIAIAGEAGATGRGVDRCRTGVRACVPEQFPGNAWRKGMGTDRRPSAASRNVGAAPRLRVTLSEYVDLLRAMATAQAAPAAEPPDRVARWIARTASLRKRPRAYGRSNRCNSGPPSAASNCARHHLPT